MDNSIRYEDNVDESQKYIDYFRSAYDSKDSRELNELWQKCNSYWEGNTNIQETENDPASNINIVHPMVEGQVALLGENNISIEIIPLTPTTMDYQHEIHSLLTWILEKNKPIKKMDIHNRHFIKFGNGIYRVCFDNSALNGFGLVSFDPINPAYIFVDPNITDPTKIQDAEFIIYVSFRSLFWAQNNPNFDKEIAKEIMPGYEPIQEVDLFGLRDGENDTFSRKNYFHLEIWTKEDGKLRKVEMSADGKILYDSSKHDVKFPKDKYPFFFTQEYSRDGTIWAKGDVELLFSAQDLINDIDDQIRTNARLTGNPQVAVSSSSGIDLDKWTNENGLRIPCNGDVNGAFRMIVPPPMAQYPIDRRKYAIEYEVPKQTRFSDAQTGIRQQGVDTATEALSLQQSGNVGIGYKKALIQETMGEMFEYIYELAKEVYTEEQMYYITGSKTFIKIRPNSHKSLPKKVPATPEFLNEFREGNPEAPLPEFMIAKDSKGKDVKEDAMINVVVKIGAGMPQNKAFMYQVIQESFRNQVISMKEYRKLLREYVNLPVSEFEEKEVTPQNLGETSNMNENPDIMGMNKSNNPMSQGGVAIDNIKPKYKQQ